MSLHSQKVRGKPSNCCVLVERVTAEDDARLVLTVVVTSRCEDIPGLHRNKQHFVWVLAVLSGPGEPTESALHSSRSDVPSVSRQTPSRGSPTETKARPIVSLIFSSSSLRCVRRASSAGAIATFVASGLVNSARVSSVSSKQPDSAKPNVEF